VQQLSSNGNTSGVFINGCARTHLRGICLAVVLLGLALLGVANLSAYPVVFTVQATGGAVIFCSNSSSCDPLGVSGAPFTLSGSFDTKDIPTSTGVGCSAGTNCATYDVASVKVTAPTILPGTVVTVSNVPITITMNSAPNPDTLYTSLVVPSLAGPITVTATAGMKNGTIHVTTTTLPGIGPDGFGKVNFVAGTAPYTFGTVLSYVGQKGNLTELTFSGTIDAVSVLHTFTGTGTDGGYPQSSLTQTGLKSGVATFFGSTHGSSPSPNSSLFGVTNNPTILDTLVSSFEFTPATQGTSSEGALLQASNGLLYGANTTSGPGGNGTIYFNTPGSSSVTVIDPTTGNPTVLPAPSSLIEASDRTFYGVTTSSTKTNVFFEITPPGNVAGSVKVLYTFTAANGVPSGPVFQANDGNFYGETTGGSTGFGEVYRLTKTGSTASFATVYSFTNGADGENPTGGLVQASDLLLYGVAAGGANGLGVVFSVNLPGTSHIAVPFSSSTGATPSGGLMIAAGNLYGITSGGGSFGLGTVFVFPLTTKTIITVHSFSGLDGEKPQVLGPSLTEGTDGRLYGTASSSVKADGSAGFGTVYSLDLRLPKPAPVITHFSPLHGPVGTVVTITGKNLTGVSSVSFHGTAAAFAPKGSNYVVATVPTGATTGTISITTPNGVTTSSATFTVP
jgi:uncharacterized repeat protein (TIGR03803 family)